MQSIKKFFQSFFKSKVAVIVSLSVLSLAVIAAAIVLLLPTLTAHTADTDTPAQPEETIPDTGSADTDTTAPDTTAPQEPSGPAFVNPLTGLEADADRSGQRPVAIMINNIRQSCPQIGIRNADVMYECLAEGDITRLMLLSSDYGALGVTGSVRSARDYFLDFAQNHDALFVHAGGSPDAYSGIAARSIDHLDGVNMSIPNMFYRDQSRINSMGYEHSLMTTGEKIVDGIAYCGYRTAIKPGFKSPFQFVEWGKSVDLSTAKDAKHVCIPFSFSEIVDMVYNGSTGLYDRFQFNGEPHIDGETGEQISFTNIILLFCNTSPIPGDEKYRITVDTTGSDTGYYITGGKVTEIKWSKPGRDDAIVYTKPDGTPLLLNRGKTYVAVVPQIRSEIEFNKAD